MPQNKLLTDYTPGELPLSEYPRPQLRRESFLCLNGRWDYAITEGERPRYYDGTILVPFSPEAPLSGVERTLLPHQTLWYRRTFTLPDAFMQDRLLLHFGAVDQCCTVYLNGQAVGSHEGGYLPFCFDVTDALEEENELIVQVRDYADTSYYSTGKQRHKRGGIWYTPQSGIWGTVWCESVPTDYIQHLRITPLYDIGAVRVDVKTALGSPVYVEVLDGQTVVAKGAAIGSIVNCICSVIICVISFRCGGIRVVYAVCHRFIKNAAKCGINFFHICHNIKPPNFNAISCELNCPHDYLSRRFPLCTLPCAVFLEL
jgi:hypothetical protein